MRWIKFSCYCGYSMAIQVSDHEVEPIYVDCFRCGHLLTHGSLCEEPELIKVKVKKRSLG